MDSGQQPFTLETQQSVENDGLLLLNPGGRVSALGWAYRARGPDYLALAVQRDISDLEYGHVYDGEGWVHIWEFDSVSAWAFSIRHTGKALFDLKWLPSKRQSLGFIGTLLQATSNGLIQIVNVPKSAPGYYYMEPIETFSVPGLIFQSLAWLKPKRKFAAGSQDGSILVFQSGCAHPIVSIWGAHALPVTALSLSYKYNQLSSCSLDGLLKLWDPKTGKCKDTVCSNKVLARQRWNYHVAWHPYGNYLFFDNDGITSPHKIVKFTGEVCEDKKHVNVSREATLSTCFSVLSGYAYIASSDGRIAAVYLKVRDSQELATSLKKRVKPWSRHLEVVNISKDDGVFKVQRSKSAKVFEDSTQLKSGARVTISPQEQAISHVDVCPRSDDELLAFAVWGGLVGVCSMQREDL